MTDKTRLFRPSIPQSSHSQPWDLHHAIQLFRKKFHDGKPTLADLIRLGKHSTVPALVLTEDAKTALVLAISSGCRSQTKDDLAFKLSRNLGLLPHFWWAGKIAFDITPAGSVLVSYSDQGDPKNELKEMRTCILRS